MPPKKESVASEFDFNAMLMYGWVADNDLLVTEINHSLRNWMRQAGSGYADAASVPMTELFQAILSGEDQNAGALLQSFLVETGALVNSGRRSARDQILSGPYSIVRVINSVNGGDTLIAAVRIVKEGGIRMRSQDNTDRVDLINICRVDGIAAEGFRVKGFQGQLQEAWLRIAPVLREGTKSGTFGLMGRNLSHNIGSHALYWVEQEEPDLEKSRFFRHLRERMELLAGFVTSMPLSTTTVRLKELEDELRSNQLLWRTIAKSEKVEKVDFRFEGSENCVALPGGVIGKQAFCTIIENIVRDCAKFSRPGAVLKLTVRATEPADEGHRQDFLRITVHEPSRDKVSSMNTVSGALRNLRISDEIGRLLPEHWGIKERYIAAALLRGIRLENLPAADLLAGCAPGGLPLLSLADDPGEELVWSFYLLKPKDVLWINDSADPRQATDGVDVRSAAWLRESIDDNVAIRHRFVILGSNALAELDAQKALRKLPNRVMAPRDCRSFDGRLTPIEFDGAGPSLATAYRCWIRQLVGAERRMPAIVISDAYPAHYERKQPRLNRPAAPSVFLWPVGGLGRWEEQHRQDRDVPMILFDRHGAEREWVDAHPVLMYEPHRAADPARGLVDMAMLTRLSESEFEMLALRLAEAALTRVIIVDERLDPASKQKRFFAEAPLASGERWDCSYNELFRWKGVNIAGTEYSEMEIPNEETLLSWIPPGEFDFAVVHRGILDKIRNIHKVTVADLCERMMARVGRLVVHSGRMGMQEVPEGVNFLPLSNVTMWLDQNYTKAQIIDELNMLRKVG